jgi:hypothetical protein
MRPLTTAYPPCAKSADVQATSMRLPVIIRLIPFPVIRAISLSLDLVSPNMGEKEKSSKPGFKMVEVDFGFG